MAKSWLVRLPMGSPRRRDDADRLAAETGEADENVLRVVLLHRAQLAVVDDRANHRAHDPQREERRVRDLVLDSLRAMPTASPHRAAPGRAGTDRYRGMLPCFLGGLRSRLPSRLRRAAISLGRVARGWMTSSM